jgi:hypothetical protein
MARLVHKAGASPALLEMVTRAARTDYPATPITTTIITIAAAAIMEWLVHQGTLFPVLLPCLRELLGLVVQMVQLFQ